MKKIGLACTGGGIKAAGNIGVIKALQEANIEISAISGTSIGSFVALMYALNISPDEMLEKFKSHCASFSSLSLADKIKAPYSLLKNCGVKSSSSIAKLADDLLQDTNLQNMNDFEIPFFVPALDTIAKKTVYYSSKEIKDEECYTNRPISEAIQSTTALPFLFKPNTITIDGELHQFIDGGMTNNTPTNHLNEFSDVVIGIESKYYRNVKGKKLNLITEVRNAFQGARRTVSDFHKKDSDIWISVDCGNNKLFGSPEDIERCFEAGYLETKKIIEENKNILF